MHFTTPLLTLILPALSACHMQLNYPPPLGGANNPFRTDPPDQYMQYPYGCCGRTDLSPCKGHLNLLGTPQGRPVATWAAGSTVGWNISGIGNHYGGSCQVGFSLDKGKTFTVATSYQGNCPHRKAGSAAEGQNFDFVIPKDIPSGEALFAWTWNNREQEFNMNCAVVTITGGASSGGTPAAGSSPSSSAMSLIPTGTAAASAKAKANGATSYEYDDADYHCVCKKPAPKLKRSLPPSHPHAKKHDQQKRDAAVSFKDRPAMLMADTKNGCQSPRTSAELKYPNPGPDVVTGDGEYKLMPPTGTC